MPAGTFESYSYLPGVTDATSTFVCERDIMQYACCIIIIPKIGTIMKYDDFQPWRIAYVQGFSLYLIESFPSDCIKRTGAHIYPSIACLQAIL